MTDLNFEQDIEIDPDALDIELLRHAPLFYKYSKYEKECKEEADRAKLRVSLAHEEVKTIRSKLILEASKDPKMKNATLIEAFYRTQPEYKAAKQKMFDAEEELIQSEKEFGDATSAVWAFNTRKVTLENLVKLVAMDYFARPSEPRDLKAEMDKEKEREERHNKSMDKAAGKLKGKRRRK